MRLERRRIRLVGWIVRRQGLHPLPTKTPRRAPPRAHSRRGGGRREAAGRGDPGRRLRGGGASHHDRIAGAARRRAARTGLARGRRSALFASPVVALLRPRLGAAAGRNLWLFGIWLEHVLKNIPFHDRYKEFTDELTNAHVAELCLER